MCDPTSQRVVTVVDVLRTDPWDLPRVPGRDYTTYGGYTSLTDVAREGVDGSRVYHGLARTVNEGLGTTNVKSPLRQPWS